MKARLGITASFVLLLACSAFGQTLHLKERERAWNLGVAHSTADRVDATGFSGSRSFSNRFELGFGIEFLSVETPGDWYGQGGTEEHVGIVQSLGYYTRPTYYGAGNAIVVGLHEAYHIVADEGASDVLNLGLTLNFWIPTSSTGGLVLYTGYIRSVDTYDSDGSIPIGAEFYGRTSKDVILSGGIEYTSVDGTGVVSLGFSLSFIGKAAKKPQRGEF